mmetsp:Transcript_4431/g.6868  ORF Transcript_4431/g.6868 Transcript_4431/m.6868 type:complete len:202 (-) Transcript_4431:1006-1611(-)
MEMPAFNFLAANEESSSLRSSAVDAPPAASPLSTSGSSVPVPVPTSASSFTLASFLLGFLPLRSARLRSLSFLSSSDLRSSLSRRVASRFLRRSSASAFCFAISCIFCSESFSESYVSSEAREGLANTSSGGGAGCLDRLRTSSRLPLTPSSLPLAPGAVGYTPFCCAVVVDVVAATALAFFSPLPPDDPLAAASLSSTPH